MNDLPTADVVGDEPELDPRDVLSRPDLFLTERFLGEGEQRSRQSGAVLVRPLAYVVPDEWLSPVLRSRRASLGVDYYGVLFAFDLEDLPAGRHYTRVRFEVRLIDEAAMPLSVRADDGAWDDAVGPWPAPPVSAATGGGRGRWMWSRLRRSGPGEEEPEIFGIRRADGFGYSLTARQGGGLRRRYGLHALVEMPVGTPDLAGSATLTTEITRTRRQRTNVFPTGLPTAAAFSERLPPGAHDDGPAPRPGTSSRSRAAVRLCVSADIEKYSRFDDNEQDAAQGRLVRVLEHARRRAGVPEAEVDRQASGDGQFAILPPAIDETQVIPDLIRGLRIELKDANAGLDAHHRLRLRVALCRGIIREAANGYVGAVSIAVNRVLDSKPLREALAGDRSADIAFAVTDSLYREVVAHGYEDLVPSEFRPAAVVIPEKQFSENAWIFVPPAL
ncbi:hypothetical protein DQ384_25555 [Sphaerisporangium album]|uniref:Guanylate cyclase domain-containing protein n=1 Tax=Sphaerisporangium album TaxID=509200 RepID=A0A367FCA4_9ACTN|nr:hypothetical protein [Sphaerisporangium album]RCG27891.1 hypothetical protein DQ384_25555 [Sphaerisporangium album]